MSKAKKQTPKEQAEQFTDLLQTTMYEIQQAIRNLGDATKKLLALYQYSLKTISDSFLPADEEQE